MTPCGPYGYGGIRSHQITINNCKYELKLIAQGMRRRLSPKRLNEIISKSRAEIRRIKAAEKRKKEERERKS